MNLRGMSARERRTVVIGGAIIVTMFVAARGASAVLGWGRDVRSDAEESRASLVSARTILSDEPRVNERAVLDGRRVIALAPMLLSGDTPASASATLEGIVSGAAATSNVQLGALELRSDSLSRSAFTRIVVKGSANGDIHGLAQMLQQLEQGPTLLAVEEMSIAQPELGAPPDHMEVLHMELVVGGLMLTPISVRAR